MGELSLAEPFLDEYFDYMKTEISNNFAFMNQYEREVYLKNIAGMGNMLNYDLFTKHSNGDEQWPKGNILAYNLALIQKGVLLNTTKDINKILCLAPDSLQKKIVLYKELEKIQINNVEDPILTSIRLELMQYVSKNPYFLSQLNYTWQDVKNNLKQGEAAIEFIDLLSLRGIKEPGVGALIIKSDSDFPAFVSLASNAKIDSIYTIDEDGYKLRDDIYMGKSKQRMYEEIWQKLEAYLDGTSTIYYAPTGYVQEINLDWLGETSDIFLKNKYDLYRLSSTRELCQPRTFENQRTAALYGGITYSINVPILKEKPTSKYRTTTRFGFMPLYNSVFEIDTIGSDLNRHSYLVDYFEGVNATEESFIRLSGKSPTILHIATHGFCYDKTSLITNVDNYIAYNYLTSNNALDKSGLALAGAQDHWDVKSASNYVNIDKSNNGILLSSEISQLDLSKTDIVVLSACETALGDVTYEGVYGLQRAFKLSGVNSIIMSLWKVDDEATKTLMNVFYYNLLSGKTKRESLLAAQNTVRNTPGFEDPYYWAGWILLDGLN